MNNPYIEGAEADAFDFGYQQGRADGIDGLVKLVCDYYTMQERAGYCADTNNMIKQRIVDFAEQLKENNKCN